MLCGVRRARQGRSAATLHLILTLLVSLTILTPVWRGADCAESAPSTVSLNKKIDNFHFADAAGKSPALYDLKDKKAVVIVFLSFECPVSTSYSQHLAELHRTYGNRGVAFVGVCPNESDPAVVAKQAKEYAIPFPVYADPQHVAVRALKAEATPEAFLLDHDFVLRYRGRIDDGYAARLKKNRQISRHDLHQALDELLAGKPVTEPATRPIGCPIHIEKQAKADGSVTYYRDVLPILQNNCQGCHRPGAVGPFSLMTYKQAINWASDIKEYAQSRKMPPWKPVDGPAFHNERRLTSPEIATLATWVDSGTPAGDQQDAPTPKRFAKGWQLGEPDLVLTPCNDFQLGASGRDTLRCYVLPTTFPEDRYVTAVEVKPSNPRVVHHALLFIDPAGQGRRLEQKERDKPKKETETDTGPGYEVAMGIGFVPQGGLGGWAPGQVPRYLPADTGYLLPKGSDVILQVHYHRDGRVEKDRTAIGLYFAKKPVRTRYRAALIPGRFLVIPAGNDRFKVTGATPALAHDATLHAVTPHMHMLGREIKATLRPPDGPPRTLVAIKDWDYNWQETYVFKEPIPVKSGTKFAVEATYDNSAKNPNNPNHPPRLVTYGEQTTNEMCYVFLGMTSSQPGVIRFEELSGK